MFKYNNTHIFTGYLKQLLSAVNLPICKIYTQEFASYLEQHGKEDPRVLESFDAPNANYPTVRINYLKNNELYTYFWNLSGNEFDLKRSNTAWKHTTSIFYNSSKNIPGLTRTLRSPGNSYDKITHEYLGEFLRFLRDYHNINLMSLYNCFNDTLCSNISAELNLGAEEDNPVRAVFNSQDPNYRIYAIPVKLFTDYTIAIDSSKGIEMFCGLYSTGLDSSAKAKDLRAKTYQKVNKTFFSQPFTYDKLNVKNWPSDIINNTAEKTSITRWDIANREQDLKLFIKVPISCKSSIVILEGNFKHYNDFKYVPQRAGDSSSQEIFVYKLKNSAELHYEPKISRSGWNYKQNHSVINFGSREDKLKVNVNAGGFMPISKLQLLAFNTGESYPFADRLVEYLIGGVITPIDNIPDNIKRAQKVMNQNQHYFKIDGLWENKMQKIIYDYIMSAGPVDVSEKLGLIDRRRGYHTTLGQTSKSTLYDILGFIDKDAEKWYASWSLKNNKPQALDSIQNVDIYNGLYDI